MTEQVFAGSAELLAGASGLYCHLARSYGFGWRGGLRSKYYDAKNFRIAFVLVRQQGNLWLHGVASSAIIVHAEFNEHWQFTRFDELLKVRSSNFSKRCFAHRGTGTAAHR